MRLAPPTGPYAVGVSTFSHVVPFRTYGKSKLPNGEHALVMEEILYNVYYPCRVPSRASPGIVPWLVRCVCLSPRGGLRRAGVDTPTRPVADMLVGFAKFTGACTKPRVRLEVVPLTEATSQAYKNGYSGPLHISTRSSSRCAKEVDAMTHAHLALQ